MPTKWEKAIQEAIRRKVYAANILNDVEWVYLVGLFQMEKDSANCEGPSQSSKQQEKYNASVIR